MGGGTGLLPLRDVKRDLAMHVYLSYLSRFVHMEIMFAGTFSSHRGKAGQILSHIYKHSVQLCGDDFMLTLHMHTASHINRF